MKFSCKICGELLDTNKAKKLSANCIFTKRILHRYICDNCGVIFGPIGIINATAQKMNLLYKDINDNHNIPDTTKLELRIFNAIPKEKDMIVLNYGSGRESKAIEEINKLGYKCYGYDPYAPRKKYSFKNKNEFKNMKFDIIMSINLIEHLQNPTKDFKLMKKLLKTNGIMAHATTCYDYCYEYTCTHLFFFTGSSINKLCKRVGLIETDEIIIKNQKLKLFRKAQNDSSV
jgi:SAM-dependent methyltransferase